MFKKSILWITTILSLSIILCSCDTDRDERFGAKTYKPGNLTSSLHSSKVTVDGGFILAGTADNNTAYDSNLWVAKTDSLGKIQWEKAYGGDRSESGIEKIVILISQEGGYIALAQTRSFGDGMKSAYWVVKISQNGNLEWQKAYKIHEEFEQTADMIQNKSGEYVIAGSSGLIKIDQMGNVIWQKSYFVDGITDTIYSIKALDDGYIVAGVFSSVGTKIGFYDGFIIRIDESGEVLWSKHYGIEKIFSTFRCVEVVEDGYLLSGTYGPWDNDVQRLLGDFWIVKVDKKGNIVSQKKYHTDGYEDTANWIEKTGENGFVVAGQVGKVNSRNTMALKFDSNGNIEWQKKYNFSTYFNQEIHKTSIGYLISGSISYRGLLINVNKQGDAPGAKFVKDVNVSINSTNVISQDLPVIAKNIDMSIFEIVVGEYVTNSEIKEY